MRSLSEFPVDASCRYSWECKHVAAASHDSCDVEAMSSRSTWPPGMTISCRQPLAFSYRDSPSPASRPASCRYTSGSADVATLAPCPIGLPRLPWRYAPEVVSRLPPCATSSPDPTSAQRARTHRPRSLSRRAMSQPVSRPLQPGIRFLRIPLPTAPTAFLAVRLPLLATPWTYPVPHEFPSGADLLLRRRCSCP